MTAGLCPHPLQGVFPVFFFSHSHGAKGFCLSRQTQGKVSPFFVLSAGLSSLSTTLCAILAGGNINIYNFWEQFCDRIAPSKYCLQKIIRQIDKTISFVIFTKCFVIFPKCCLRRALCACRMAMNRPKSTGAASRLLQVCSGAMQR